MKALLFIAFSLFLISTPSIAQTTAVKEENFFRIGGIEQWVTIKGEDASKPVILFLHGGPGSPLSPFADAIFREWEKDFVLVQWDQRGSGKTFGTYAPEELDEEFLKSNPLTVELVTRDGIELAEFLKNRLGKEKIILFGTSWGSVPGAKMAVERPDLFYALLCHSQVVNPTEDGIRVFNRVAQLVEEAKDTESAEILNEIGAPPYEERGNSEKFLRVVKRYESKNSNPSPASWLEVASAYNSPEDNQHRTVGDDYSFLNYVGHTRFGIKAMASTINLAKDTYQFKIPVYLVQGEEDILTPKEITRQYFDQIEAPNKEYILVSAAAQEFNPAVVSAMHKILKENF